LKGYEVITLWLHALDYNFRIIMENDFVLKLV